MPAGSNLQEFAHALNRIKSDSLIVYSPLGGPNNADGIYYSFICTKNEKTCVFENKRLLLNYLLGKEACRFWFITLEIVRK